MDYHRGVFSLFAGATILAAAILLCARIGFAQANMGAISGCRALSAEAADTEAAAAAAYAKGHYKEGAPGFQQAADLYHLCSIKASDSSSKDRAFYAYVVDLAFAAQHASNGATLTQRVRKEADAFLNRSSDPDLKAKISALKNDPTHPERVVAAGGAGSQNSPSAPPVASGSIDRAACDNALADFWKPYGDWFSARERYVGSVQKTQRLLPKGNGPSYMYGPASINIILELRAIRSVVDAEEPKLVRAQSRLNSTGASQTARAAAEIVQAIQQLDASELAWTQARYNAITALANGQAAPDVPAYSTDTENQLGAQIKTRWDQLHGASACTS